MGTISRVTTWSTGDTLTAADLNGEFDNILSTANGSLNADNLGVTAGIASALKAVVLDSNKDFADGTGSNQIRNLTISGSLKIGTTFLPDASGGADLGSSSLEWGDLYIADDKFINLGSDQNILIGYDETTTDSLKIAATEGAALAITLMADEGDDAGDEWKLNVADGGTITLGNDIASAGTYVTHLTLTPHATVSSSTLALAGGLTVAGTAGITGIATVGGLTIGSAAINEAELEAIDGVTAGTVAASKAVVVDSNKDIGTFRNITLNGTLSDGNYTFDTSGNVTGLGTVGSGAITSTGVVTGTGFTIGSAAINEAELETIDGVTAGTVAASKAVVVDSNKDIASFRNVTLTGELDAATGDFSGDVDVDGTLEADAITLGGTALGSLYSPIAGSTSIVTVGTVGTGTWQGTAVALAYGGTGLVGATDGKIVIADGSGAPVLLDVGSSTAITVLGTVATGTWQGTAVASAYLDADTAHLSTTQTFSGAKTFSAAAQFSNTVTVGVDDTGYDVQFFGATSGSSLLWDQSADDLILTNAGLAVGSDATGDVYYRDANGFLARLAIGSDGQVLTSTGTLPNWEAAGAGGSFSGPGSSTDNAVVRFNGTGGATGQNSGVIIDDSNNVTGAANVTLSGELDAATGDFSGIIDVAGAATLASLVCTAGGTFGGGYGATGATISTAGVGQFNGALTTDGVFTAASLDISGNADIDGTTNLDAVDIDGAVQIDNTVTVGVDNTGHDVKFFGATSGKYMEWDESADRLNVSGTMGLGASVANANQSVGLHICTADASATVNASNDELILEGNTSVGMSLLTDSDGVARITWGHGSGTDAYSGQIGYYNDGDYMNFLTASTERMRVDSNGHLALGQTGAAYRLDVLNSHSNGFAGRLRNDGNNSDRWGLAIMCGADNAAGTNTAIDFYDGDGTLQGAITFSGGTVTYGAFTANHDAELPEADSDGYEYGTLVETTEIFYQKNSSGDDFERGIRYKARKSSSANSKALLGAYAGKYGSGALVISEAVEAAEAVLFVDGDELPEGKSIGDVKTPAVEAVDAVYSDTKENLHQIYVLGDGHVLCNNSQGNIEVGDGITSSTTDGIGCKSTVSGLIIAIAQQDISFTGSETKLVPVQYGLQQWVNLSAIDELTARVAALESA